MLALAAVSSCVSVLVQEAAHLLEATCCCVLAVWVMLLVALCHVAAAPPMALAAMCSFRLVLDRPAAAAAYPSVAAAVQLAVAACACHLLTVAVVAVLAVT